MFADQMTTVAIGLIIIIPAILLLRWVLTRGIGTPDDVADHHIRELQRRYQRGEIDEATYRRHLEQLADE